MATGISAHKNRDFKQIQTISVAVITRSRRNAFIALLSNLASQTRIPDEIIVIENVVEQKYSSCEAIRKVLPSFCRVKYHQISKKNIAPGYARNICLNDAKGDLLLFLDDDIGIEKDFIEKSLKWFSVYPDAAALMPKVLSETNDMWSKFSESLFNSGKLHVINPTFIQRFTSCACILNLHVVKTAHMLFDETLSACEDFLFSKQLLAVSGKKCVYIPQLTVHHQFSSGNPYRSFIKRFSWYANNFMNLEIRYQVLVKEEVHFIEKMMPHGMCHLLFYPVYLLKNIADDVIALQRHNNLSVGLLIPNIMYNVLAYYRVFIDKNFSLYAKKHLKEIIKNIHH